MHIQYVTLFTLMHIRSLSVINADVMSLDHTILDSNVTDSSVLQLVHTLTQHIISSSSCTVLVHLLPHLCSSQTYQSSSVVTQPQLNIFSSLVTLTIAMSSLNLLIYLSFFVSCFFYIMYAKLCKVSLKRL